MVCEAAVAVQPAYPAVPAVKAEAMQQQLEQQESPSSILHFNWDQRQTARAAMNTLVQALADDPVNNYFSGSKRVRFVKDEVGLKAEEQAVFEHWSASSCLREASWQDIT